MKAGQIVLVTTEAVPKGIIPDKHVELLFEYELNGKVKWYGIITNQRNLALTNIVDSGKVTILQGRKV